MKISNLVIHHSAGDHGSAAQFRELHRSWGWSDIGYHFVIDNEPDGVIQPGRDIYTPGAQARGHNTTSLGICLVGDGAPPVTPRQVESCVDLCASLCLVLRLDPETAIVGHRDLCATDCPGDDLYGRLPVIRAGVARRLREMRWDPSGSLTQGEDTT